VLRDAGTGAIEGLTAAAGASLAARVVRGATIGLPAGRAAASVGARAVMGTSKAGSELAAAVIDGALGGASGELFQTATDEATWDRGVAEAFAAMLAAIARGAATGAALGGAIGGAGQALGKLARSTGQAGEHTVSGEARAVAHGHSQPLEHAGATVDSNVSTRASEHSAPGVAGKAAPPAGGLQQQVSDLDSLYEQAAVAHEQLSQATKDIAQAIGGEAVVPPLKGRARAIEKAQADYGGDVSRLVDLARSTIVCENFEQVNQALTALQSRLKVVRLKNRFENPSGGYRDILANVELSNGHIGEIQINLRGMLEAKEGEGHKLFEKIRSIEARAAIERRPLTPEELTLRDQYKAQMKALYDAAFDKANHTNPGEHQ
jgi:hypothetical protein